MTMTRPILRYHGGKWLLAPWIISHMPPHRTYVEPFGGAASVLLRKGRCYAEVYNDLGGEVVNLFQVLRSPRAGELIAGVELTAFARAEFEMAYEIAEDAVERARRLVVRSAMGFGSGLAVNFQSTGFRGDSTKPGTTPAHDWLNLPSILAQAVRRLRGVVIECRPAAEVIARYDAPDVLFYIDPPYVHATRSHKVSGGTLHHRYTHEMTDEDHAALLDQLVAAQGQVMLSGYSHPLYDAALASWRRVTREALADGAVKRTEVLWMNFAPPAGRFL